MKKTIVALLALVGTTVATFGQAQVVLANLSGPVDAPIGARVGAAGAQINPGPDARVQLYLAGSNTAITPATTFLDFAGFEKYLNQVTLTIPDNAGTAVDVRLRGWMTTGPGAGTTWEAAASRGESSVFSVTPTMAPATPPDLVGLTSFDIIIVPEPSTIALGVLGAAALLLRRRK
jgi:hypothetical protein